MVSTLCKRFLWFGAPKGLFLSFFGCLYSLDGLVRYILCVEAISVVVDVSEDVRDVFQYNMKDLMWSTCYHLTVISCTLVFMRVFIRFGQLGVYTSCRV
jgi:hypothetical protein